MNDEEKHLAAPANAYQPNMHYQQQQEKPSGYNPEYDNYQGNYQNQNPNDSNYNNGHSQGGYQMDNMGQGQDQGQNNNYYNQEGGNPPPYTPDFPPDYNYKPNPNAATFDEAFAVPKPKWNDKIGLVILALIFSGYLALSIIVIRAYAQTHSFQGWGIYSGENDYSLNTHTLILYAFVLATAIVLSLLYFIAARVWTKQFIWITYILHLLFSWGTAIYYLAVGYYSAGIVFIIFAALTTWWFWCSRKRIPFATIVLQTLIDVTRANPSVLIISAIGAVVAAAFGTWFAFTIVSIYVKYDPDNRNPGCMTTGGSCSNGKLIGLILFTIFCGYYLTEVIKNVIHVTISGVYGSWYYCSKSDQGMPKHAAMSSFRRAITYSLGSISLGSLIVSIINFIRQILSVLQQDARQSGDTLATVILCFVQCCFGVLDWLVTYFNHYAYSYIALYGKAYVPSAKATWKLMQTRGIDAMVNDSLIGSVLSFGASFVAYAAALVAYCFLKYTDPSYNSGGGFYAPVVGLAFVIALQVSNITNVSLKSGCSTFFLALARDPEVLRASYPEIYEEICRTYPPAREKLDI